MTTFGSDIALGGIIARLEREDPTRVLPIGFADPHSYRGYYEQLAFEPRRNIAIGEMLAAARSALGETYQGYKGGDYTMSEWTSCWIANYGETSDNLIGPLLLELLLAQPEPSAAAGADHHGQGERPWCGAPRDLGGQQPCPIKVPCGPGQCAIAGRRGQGDGQEAPRNGPLCGSCDAGLPMTCTCADSDEDREARP